NRPRRARRARGWRAAFAHRLPVRAASRPRRERRPTAFARFLDGSREGRAAGGLRPLDRRACLAYPRGDRGRSEEAAPHRDRARSRLPVRQGTGLMRRLYLRIYLAVLASLAAFALAAGLLWRAFGDDGPWSQAYEVAATLAQNALPPAGAAKTEQQAALEKLAANLRADVALFAPDRSPLAAVGEPLYAPLARRTSGCASLRVHTHDRGYTL